MIKKELKYYTIVGTEINDKGEIVPKRELTTKTIELNDLSQNDKRQGRLFFMLRPLYKSSQRVGEIETSIIADPLVLHDITIHAIDVLVNIDDNFTQSDKAEFLNDNFAVMEFGEWFLEYATPFFLRYLTDWKK